MEAELISAIDDMSKGVDSDQGVRLKPDVGEDEAISSDGTKVAGVREGSLEAGDDTEVWVTGRNGALSVETVSVEIDERAMDADSCAEEGEEKEVSEGLGTRVVSELTSGDPE